jgi:hypothetical protein
MARPQIDTLRSLDRPFTSARLSVAEARYLQKALVSVSSKLLAGASRMWQNRSRQYTTPVNSYATMTSDRLTPGSVQPSIHSAFSALRAASDTLSTVRDTDTFGNLVQLEYSPGPLISLDFPSPSPSPTDSSPQDSPTPSAHSPQLSASIPLSTGLSLTGNSIYPADNGESSTEDDPLAHFVSVRDLQNNPGCTELDFTEYRPISPTNDMEVPETYVHASDV